MNEFEMDGNRYRINKLDTIKQWHLSRKVSPLIPPLIPVFMKIARAGGLMNDIEGIGELLGPFAEGISTMSDEHSEYVFNTCLGAVQRFNGVDSKWLRIWVPESRMSMFPELNDISKAIPIVVKVIWDALGPFINGLLTAQQTEEPAATA